MKISLSILLSVIVLMPSQSRAAETSTPEAVKAAGHAGFNFLGIKGIFKRNQSVPSFKPAPATSPTRPPYPTGRFVNANGGPERFTLDDFGRLRTNIQVRLGTGQAGDVVFPHSLRYNSVSGGYSATGSFSIDYWTNRGVLRCTWPIQLQVEFSGDGRSADMTLVGNQLNYLDVFGGCQAIGQAKHAFGFVKDDNWAPASAPAFQGKAVIEQK